MGMVTWLHIAGLYFKDSPEYDANIVLDTLLEDVAACIQREHLSLNLIFVTGDIAFSGKPLQYTLAQSFFDRLLVATGLTHDLLFLVPGNHDVDGDLISQAARGISSSLSDRKSSNAVLMHQPDRRIMTARFAGYANFVKDYLGRSGFENETSACVRTISIGGQLVAVLALNSAWLFDPKTSRSKELLVGEYQVREALAQAEGVDLKIAMLHHPFSWLREFDRQESASLLIDDCDFILHSHQEPGEIVSRRDPSGATMIIGSGACCRSREHHNTYNFIQFDPCHVKGEYSYEPGVIAKASGAKMWRPTGTSKMARTFFASQASQNRLSPPRLHCQIGLSQCFPLKAFQGMLEYLPTASVSCTIY